MRRTVSSTEIGFEADVVFWSVAGLVTGGKNARVQVEQAVAVKQRRRNGVAWERRIRHQAQRLQLVLVVGAAGGDIGHHQVGSRSERRRLVRQARARLGNVRRIDGVLHVGAGAGQDLAPLFVVEEERLLLVGVVHVRDIERPADVVAEDVVVGRRARSRRSRADLVEEGVGVVVGGAVELPRLAMELLRAALERKAHGGARRNTVVRWIVRCQHVELGDGVLRRHDVHAAGAAAIVSLAAVDQPDVVALAQAVDAQREAGCYRGRRVGVGQSRN